MGRKDAGGAVLQDAWHPPSPARPSDEVAAFIYGKDPKGLLEQREQSDILECPNCHVQHPASVPVKCGCGNTIIDSACHVCGHSFDVKRVRLFCPVCRKVVPHAVKQGYSAERLAGMYGGFSAAFSLMFRPDAYSMLNRMRKSLVRGISAMYEDVKAGCMVDRCKFTTGALGVLFIPRDKLIGATPERLQELDEALREADLGYLMSKEEAILAEKMVMEVRG